MSLFKAPSKKEAEQKVTEGGDLTNLLQLAQRRGWVPRGIQQTIFSGDDGHILLTRRRPIPEEVRTRLEEQYGIGDFSAWISSYEKEDRQIVYRLHEPDVKEVYVY